MPTCKKSFSKRSTPKGQSLIEFVGVFPILFIAAVAGACMVIGSQQGNIAAMGMNAIALNKMKMADQDGAVGGGGLSGYVNGGKFKAPLSSGGSILDSVNVQTVDAYTDVAVGSKQFISPLTSFVPGFTIQTPLIINHHILQAASSGSAPQKSSSTPWVPGGTPVTPPWT